MQKTGAGVATVTIVPIAPAVVIFDVAELVAYPSSLTTLASACRGGLLLFVQTSAFGAILVILVTSTAVAAIPVANRVVV